MVNFNKKILIYTLQFNFSNAKKMKECLTFILPLFFVLKMSSDVTSAAYIQVN